MSFTLAYSIIVPTLTLAALLYAGIEDILYREVRRDVIWLLMVIFGLILDILYIIFSSNVKDAVLEILISVVFGFLLGFILFYAGIWGGADTKALWALSILTPIHPFTEGLILGHQSIPVISSAVFSLLINSGLLTVIYPLILIAINTFTRTKGLLFEEVRGSPSQKVRCFLFGYKKEIEKINPKKIHFMFLETKKQNQFEGSFTGDFEGRLDGTFLGYFNGKISGVLTGKIIGKFAKENFIHEKNVESVLVTAKKFSDSDILTIDEFDEIPDPVLEQYRKDFILTEENEPEDLFVNTLGKTSIPIEGYFCGMIEGLFEGKIEGEVLGSIEGDFKGISKKGKLSGTKTNSVNNWELSIKTRLEEEDQMVKNQLRTLWQLKESNKKTVWVMPGIPFVFLMFIGYILYLLFGNLALLLFTI